MGVSNAKSTASAANFRLVSPIIKLYGLYHGRVNFRVSKLPFTPVMWYPSTKVAWLDCIAVWSNSNRDILMLVIEVVFSVAIVHTKTLVLMTLQVRLTLKTPADPQVEVNDCKNKKILTLLAGLKVMPVEAV